MRIIFTYLLFTWVANVVDKLRTNSWPKCTAGGHFRSLDMSQKISWCMLIFAVTLVRGNEVVNTLASVLIDSLEFNLQHDEFLDTNMLFGVAIVSGNVI